MTTSLAPGGRGQGEGFFLLVGADLRVRPKEGNHTGLPLPRIPAPPLASGDIAATRAIIGNLTAVNAGNSLRASNGQLNFLRKE